MLLDRIDIDSHGPLNRVSLGPFSQSLTAVVAASGTGKTALVRFLRDSLTGTTPAREGLAQSNGRVVWAAGDGLYHCLREPNGTTQGRRFVEFEPRFVDASRHHSRKLGREAIVIDLPPSVVDGIVTDTALTDISRCVQAAITSGLDNSVSTANSTREHEIKSLRSEIADLERQIHSYSLHTQLTASAGFDTGVYGLGPDFKRLRDRRAELALEITAIDARRDWSAKADSELDRRRRKRELFSSIADEIERLRRQESELRIRLSEIESSLERMDDEATRAESREAIAKAYRNRLEQVDVHLTRVRRVVREIRALGDHWFGGRSITSQAGWLEQAIDGVAAVTNEFALDHDTRLIAEGDNHGELDIIDRGWNAGLAINPNSSESQSTEDIQRRLDAVCRMVDNLVGRCEEHQSDKSHTYNEGSRLGDWDLWAENELSRLDRRRRAGEMSDAGRNRESWSTSEASKRRTADFNGNANEDFEPTRSLDHADRLLQEERQTRLETLPSSGENISWIAATLNGVSQRLRGLAGRCSQYGASNVTPLFHSRSGYDLDSRGSSNDSLDPQAYVAAVRRCERELVEVLRHLIVRRDVMLRRIAEAKNQPLSQVVTAMNDPQQCHDDPQLYQWLVRDRIIASESDAKHLEATRRRLQQQRSDLITDIKRTVSRTTDRLAEAETIRTNLRSLPVVYRLDDDSRLRERLVAEIKAIDEQLARPQVDNSLVQRHAHCVGRLRTLMSRVSQISSLAAAASDYLQRLTSGRLRTIAWHRASHGSLSTTVEIDGRSETGYSVTDRFAGTLAVRLAAADELARRGRELPLFIETPSQRAFAAIGSQDGFRTHLQNLVETLADVSRRGRQIIVLTDDAIIADAITRVGGSVHSIRGGRYEHRIEPSPLSYRTDRMFDVNRDFDLAWREANGNELPIRREDYRNTVVESPVDAPTNRYSFHNGSSPRFDATVQVPSPANEEYLRTYESREELSPMVSSGYRQPSQAGRVEAVDRPFFLTGHSPVEEAPSIDSLTASRLRAIGVHRIEHLLAADPKELAISLGLPEVDATAVRRWQYECRLVCGVRKLRGFDARVLVGSGITHPRELAETDPAALAERVEAFLSTDRGVKILRSGTRQEISRLTDWVTQAKHKSAERNSITSEPIGPLRPVVKSSRHDLDHDREPRNRERRERDLPGERHLSANATKTSNRDASAPPPARQGNERATRSDAAASTNTRFETLRKQSSSQEPIKFYLSRNSDVEAGPSIGPRMAERLHRIGVKTVDDLVNRSANSIADALKLSKVDANMVRQWQQQAVLVCRVPMLRGHDAQLLVAAGITDPQRLAECDPSWLLSQVEPVANSREGKAMLRGGKHPDLAEMHEWIRNAQQHREMIAA